MKAQTRKWIGLILVCSAFAFTGMQVNAQESKIAQATIPFQFWIGDTALPAGDYEIQHFVSSTLVLFRSKNGKAVQQAYMAPLDDSVVKPNQAKLVFVNQDGRHYLYAFWGVYGKRGLTADIAQPAPPTNRQLDVPVVYR
jgi:hypothetical protein